MALSLKSCLLLAATLTTAIAVPADNPRHFHPYSVAPLPHRTLPNKNPITRLRDAIIQTIWGPLPQPAANPLYQRVNPHNAVPANFRTRYSGDAVLRFRISSQEELTALAQVSDILFLDVWEATDDWVDIRIAKDIIPSVLSLLPVSLHNSYTLLMHDLAQTVYETFPSDELSPETTSHRGFTPVLGNPGAKSVETRELFFQDYQQLSMIYPWMRLMASLFPTHVRVVSIGRSFEGRDIAALRVGVHPTNNEDPLPPRKTILVFGGSHAREWISTTTVNYIAYSLITRYGKVGAVTNFLEKYDLVFVPTLNPDGYVYTWERDRLWRKNRQVTDLPFCQGVDLDRTFGFMWDGEPSKSNPCSESYAGVNPFEGVESSSLANWALNETTHNNVTFVAVLDLHSYSQQVLYPYAYSCEFTPPALENLQEVAMGMAKAFRLSSGHFYSVSSACEGTVTGTNGQRGEKIVPKMDQGGGSAIDWFHHELGVRYTYQIKLRDTGSYGFLLPKAHIVPTGQETYNAVLALGRYLMGDNGIELNWEAALQGEQTAGTPQQPRVEHADLSDFAADALAEMDASTAEPEDDDEDRTYELRRRRRRR